MRKILLVSSSSGGHIYPSLALKKRLKELNYQVTSLGVKNQMEEKIIKEDVVFFDVPNSFKRAFSFEGIRKIIHNYKEIKDLINSNDLIIGFGGFITFLIAIINFRKRKMLVHEQNVVLGDSLKYSYFFYDKLLLSFNNELNKIKKSIYTSNPTIDGIYKRSFVNLTNPKVMFVFGSLSSLTCLKKVRDFLLETSLENHFLIVVPDKYKYLFQKIDRKDMQITNHVNMKEVLKDYDLVFTRGGASTLIELLKANVEICCIPSKYVKNNHQEKNAKYLYNLGLISIINENQFNTKSIENQIKNISRKNNYSLDFSPIDKFLEVIENE